jgi:Cell Wall Hydrolase
MILRFCRPGRLAVVLAALYAALGAVGAASAESPAATRAPSVLESAGAALAGAIRPRARSDEEITVASRSVDPGSSARLSSGPRKTTPLPSRLEFRDLDAMPKATGDAQWQCLAKAIYFESRGEPLEGQVAVAEVILNRVSDRRFPDTVCAVTTQGAGSGRGCQFSYACDGHSDTMKSSLARDRSEKLASVMLAGRARALTDGATYFHTRSVRPGWSRRMTRTTTIGHHIFYRPALRVADG